MENQSSERERLAELIKDLRVAMFTTFPADGGPPHTRPMYTQKVEPESFDGDLWFMTAAASNKVREIDGNAAVMVTYSDAGKERYVVVHGEAYAEVNAAKAKELWNIHDTGWWPGGPTDPNMRLIRVAVSRAEYWEGPSQASYMLSLLKAVVKGDRIELKSDHGVVQA